MSRNLRAIALLALTLALPRSAAAQEGGSIAARIVADRLVVRCDLSSAARRVPVNLLVEFDTAASLQIHPQTLQGLRAQPGALLTAHFPGFKIEDMVAEGGDNDLFARLTKIYSPQLGEVQLVGAIGYEVLKRYHLIFDLPEGQIHLNPPRRPGDPTAKEAQDVEAVLDRSGGQLWFPVQRPDGGIGMMALGSSRYDTVIDRDVCRELRHPAGDIGSLGLGALDLSRFVAFRPAQFNAFHKDGALGRIGLNLLLNFRVEVDGVNGLVRFRQSRPPQFPQADLDYFRAMVQDEAQPVEDWLTAHPTERLSEEASDLLLDRRLSGVDTDDEAIGRALHFVRDTRPADLQASAVLELMEKLEEQGHVEVAVRAGPLGIEKGRLDRDSQAVHKIHGKMGGHLLESGDRKEAWRHLLAAAFGIKDDGPVNLNLGRLYEEDGRLTRAFARYVYAVIKPESAPKALDGLKRVQKALGEGDGLSIDTIEKLLAGKIPGYGIGDRFKPTKKNSSNRTVLAELFTGAHCRPCIAADLAFDGLASHFPRENLAIVEYHLHVPAPEPLTSPLGEAFAQRYGVNGTPTAIIDGTDIAPGGGPEEEKENVYLAFKEKVLAHLLQPSEHTIELETKVEGGVVSGRLKVTGPAARARLHVILVEKGVLFPGRNNVVIHHWVARGSLLGGEDGAAFKPDASGSQELTFSRRLHEITNELEEKLAADESQGAAFSMYPTLIDGEQVSVIAFLRDEASGAILQARQVEPLKAEPGQAGDTETEGHDK